MSMEKKVALFLYTFSVFFKIGVICWKDLYGFYAFLISQFTLSSITFLSEG